MVFHETHVIKHQHRRRKKLYISAVHYVSSSTQFAVLVVCYRAQCPYWQGLQGRVRVPHNSSSVSEAELQIFTTSIELAASILPYRISLHNFTRSLVDRLICRRLILERLTSLLLLVVYPWKYVVLLLVLLSGSNQHASACITK